MKPDFALSMSFDGITLLHRAAGGWRRVGDVSLDAADLTGALADLRDKALQLAPDGIATKLILPNDQIRYFTVETGGYGGDALHEIVQAALTEATPYDLSDVVYDVSPHGQMSHIAAVARETLAEAENFAAEHAFNPVCFVAIPDDQPFLGEPYFGETAGAAERFGPGYVESDGIAVVVIGDVARPESAPAPDPDPEPEPAHDAPDDSDQVGFTSRRPTRQITPPEAASEAQAVPEPDRDVDRPVPEIAHDPEDLVEDTEPEPMQVAVTAPGLDVPETVEEPQKPAPFGAFFSRRTLRAKPAPAGMTPRAANPVAAVLPDRQVPRNEAARMTVFGARQADEVGGKPAHLGLILTAALLIFLGAVALWASIFLDDGIAGLFKFGDGRSEIALTPAVVPAPAVQDTGPVRPAAPASPADAALPVVPAPDTPPANPAAAPRNAVPELSETDIAVLDALGQAQNTPVDAAAPAPDQPALSLLPPPRDITGQRTGDGRTAAVTSEATRHAATGIWTEAPEPPETPPIIGLDDLFVASIDRTDLSHDALALPDAAALDTDVPLQGANSPAAAGTNFDLDNRGLVAASRDGTLNPDGILVYLGRPPIVPQSFPERAEPEDETIAVRARLARLRPKLRPENLAELQERSQLGGLTREELAGVRPRMRPQNVPERVEAPAESVEDPAQDPDTPPTAQAVVTSLRPDARPDNIDEIVREALKSSPPSDTGSGGSTAAATVQPRIPSSASVARQATVTNAINLRRVNLIGVYGTPSNRRALIRLPSGRYKKVQVGDRVDGGRVLAIGDGELRYQKGGRNVTLTIPSG